VIAHLTGTVRQRRPGEVVLEVGGVGYRVSVPLSTYSALPGDGSRCELFIHTHVREDTLALYGFASERERNVFELLISVSGIGPRLASNVLSGIDASDLLAVLAERDLERLQAIPGVGRKTAERLALELGERARDLAGSEPAAGGGAGGLERDLVSALINLGFSATQAERAGRAARRSLGPEASLADAVREALRQITGRG
jgi:Holliday junction DNA helicase RuvA